MKDLDGTAVGMFTCDVVCEQLHVDTVEVSKAEVKVARADLFIDYEWTVPMFWIVLDESIAGKGSEKYRDLPVDDFHTFGLMTID